MTDLNWKSEELEVDLDSENDVAALKMGIVEGSLELPPDLAEDAPEAVEIEYDIADRTSTVDPIDTKPVDGSIDTSSTTDDLST